MYSIIKYWTASEATAISIYVCVCMWMCTYFYMSFQNLPGLHFEDKLLLEYYFQYVWRVSLDFGLSHQDTHMHEEYKDLHLSEVYICGLLILFFIIPPFLLLSIYYYTKTWKKQNTCILLCLQITVSVPTNCIDIFINIFVQNTTRWSLFFSWLDLQ